MAFGIVETGGEHPTGTTLLESLDHQRREKAHVVLVPEPSQSLDDPLNMPRMRREFLFLVIIFGACLTGVIGPLLVPGFGIIAVAFKITITQVTLLNGSLVMALGVSSYVCSCLATIYGKRLIYLFTSILLIATSCWGAAAKTYTSLLVARVFQGLGMGGFFALAGTASINDIFFVHERGTRVGLWNFAVIVSVNVAPIISGYVIVDLGWRWSFWLLAIAFGVLFALVILFMPETTFDRFVLGVATPPSINNPESTMSDEKAELGTAPPQGSAYYSQNNTVSATSARWKKVLGIQNVSFSNQSRIVQILISPFTLLQHPVVVWACAMWSVTFTWVIIQGAVASQIFAAPPYNLSPTQVGNLVGIAPLIGSALGTVFGGWSCDFISKKLAIRNGGIYEPEFRLWVMVPFLLTMVVGSFGLGMAIHNELSAIVCGVFLAILNFAVGVGCTGIVTYSNDVCQHRAGEAFGITMLIKSAFAFGLTFVLNDYYARAGPRTFFFTWGGLTVGVTMMTIPLYVYGKKIRSWTMRHNVL